VNLNDAHATALAIMLQHGLRDWRFAFDRGRSRFGACHHGRKKITLSRPLAALNPEAEVRDTILHEVAHALAGHKAGHGRAWKAKAAEIGAKPERCYDSAKVVRPPHKLRGTCPCGKVSLRRDRALRGRSCVACGKPIEWKKN
jgi:predicted SprT family Zn-dependent metalloprotease